MVSIHILWNHGYFFGCLSWRLVGGGARRSHGGWCVDDQDNGFQLRREGSGLIRNNFLQPLCKRLCRNHVWREAKLWFSRRRKKDVLTISEFLRCLQQRVRGSGIIYKVCVTYWTAESRMRWLVCLGKDAPELQKRRRVSWGDGGGAGLRQNCDKWVTRWERELQEHMRVCSYGAFAPQELIPDDSAVQIWYRSHYGHVTASPKLDTACDASLCQFHSGCGKTDNKDE